MQSKTDDMKGVQEISAGECERYRKRERSSEKEEKNRGYEQTSVPNDHLHITGF